MNEIKYSVLMSVYYKEKADFLRESMESIFNQTLPTDDFILVCDGALNDELDDVITEMQLKFGDALNVLRLEKNSGLGYALNEGLKYCKYELVARMDSDDISLVDRCERQVEVFKEKPEITICSGTVWEFQKSTDVVTGKRELPILHEDICNFSHKRNPFNHPAVMFRKSAVKTVGGYREKYHLFEDYYLWVRMLMKGYRGYNLPEPLLYMRTPADMYKRRGGKAYANNMLRFHKWMKQTGWTKSSEYVTGALPHAIVCVLPNEIRGAVYKVLH